ncbi:MAG: Ig-like domain-containing protein [Clostridia bacterium]|nr:Ig-like domain-containing protein [Clostridia bacterium]
MKKVLCLVLSLILLCALGLTACDLNGSGDTVIEITNISLNKTELTLTEGEEETLFVDFAPADATDWAVEWSSSDTDVATVDCACVTAVAEGEAVITAKTYNGKTATCTVTVVAKQEEPEPEIKHAVTYHARGGKFESGKDTYELQVKDCEKLTAVTVTRDDGYAFAGWYQDEDLTREWDFDEYVVNDETSLYAGWKYINGYQSVIDALANKIRADRGDDSLAVEIILIFTNEDGYLCFVEKSGAGAASYATGIKGFGAVKDNAELISQIADTHLTKIKDYNYEYEYTTDNNIGVAYYMAKRYTWAEDILYSCVSEWEENTEHFINNGPWYSCNVKAIVADEDGHVLDYSFSVISGVKNFDAVTSGFAMSEEFDVTSTALGELADDFYSEWLKSQRVV